MKVRAVFISDTHLGTKASRAEFLNEFLSKVETDFIYLIGDIIDGWQIKRGVHWDKHHDKVISSILNHVNRGAKIVYLSGNHDEAIRRFLPLGIVISGVHFADEFEHTTSKGKRFLLIHGDQFDSIVIYAKFITSLGNHAYIAAIWLNRHFNKLRAKLGYPYWSLSSFLKGKVKEAINIIFQFELFVTNEAKTRGFDGVICGHIHHAKIQDMNGIQYINCGDWVESCTAIVENIDGSLELIDWAKINAFSFLKGKSHES